MTNNGRLPENRRLHAAAPGSIASAKSRSRTKDGTRKLW